MRTRTVKLSVLAVAAASFFLLLSCGTGGRQTGENSAPASSPGAPSAAGTAQETGGGGAESPTVPDGAPSAESPSPSLPALPADPPEEWKDGGIFSDCYDTAYRILGHMTLEERIGQMLLVRCPRGDAAGFVRDFHPGGLVLFEIDFRDKTRDGVVDMLRELQKAAKLPMILAVDEEGGSVVRISGNPNLAATKFESPQTVYASGGLDAVTQDTLDKAALLKDLGLNLNLAPDVDVSVDPGDYIYPRALGQPAKQTGAYAAAVVTAMRSAGLSSALKHFPGYGNNADTHSGIATDDRPYSRFVQSDFVPFEKGIAAGAECVLVSHNIVNCMDEGVPASLSPAVHQILRSTLKFTGIVMTDDLSMAAVRDYASGSDPAVLAVLAGNDMLLLDDYESAFSAILKGVKTGVVPEGLINRAVFRILAWKLDRGVIGQQKF